MSVDEIMIPFRDNVPSKIIPDSFVKNDSDKLRLDLVPPEVEVWLAEIYGYGLKKYGEDKADNWKKCTDIRRYIAAFKRHFSAWQLGEDLDKESGYRHLHHALWNLVALTYLTKTSNNA